MIHNFNRLRIFVVIDQNLMRKYFIFSIFLLLFSCNSKNSEQTSVSKKLTVEETIKFLLSDEYQETLGIDDEGKNLLAEFYKQRNYKPLWAKKSTLLPIGDTLKQLLQTPVQFGMSDHRFDLTWNSDEPLQDELVMVCGLIRSYNDLRYGMLDSSATKLAPNRYVSLQEIDTLLDFSKQNFYTKFLNWGPKDTVYQALAYGLYEFVQKNGLQDEKIEIKTYKEDSIAAVDVTKHVLIEKGYLKGDTVIENTQFLTSLKKFQSENGCNPDGKIGKGTIQQLSETNLHKAQRIALAMEKQRKTAPFPKRYFRINIPEYMLRLYNDDTLCSENKIIIGTLDHQTPELTSALQTVVVYPYWNVPYSIASKEILPALQKNVNYLEKNDMVLLKKGDTINPHKVKWSKIKQNAFPYRVVQQPGYRNSLGILKFDFHNKYDVYFHDTPSKGLFKTIARSYSHGCMRTENPVELAKIVMTLDENTMVADSIDSLLSRTGVNHFIRLKKRIPIIIEYRSVIIEDHSVKILRDIYFRDDKYIAVMFKKNTVSSL